jgi:hypothetical protein
MHVIDVNPPPHKINSQYVNLYQAIIPWYSNHFLGTNLHILKFARQYLYEVMTFCHKTMTLRMLAFVFHASKFLSGKLRRFIPLYGGGISLLLQTDHFGKYFNVYVAKFMLQSE